MLKPGDFPGLPLESANMNLLCQWPINWLVLLNHEIELATVPPSKAIIWWEWSLWTCASPTVAEASADRLMEQGAWPVDGITFLSLITALLIATSLLRRYWKSKAQRRRWDSHRMDGSVMLDEFTAALIHEIRQPLTAILDNAQAARRFMAQEPPALAEIKAILEDIIQDTQWLDRMIHRLHALFIRGASPHRVLDINVLLRDISAALLREQSAGDVTLIMDLDANLPRVLGDPVQLQQVILNLLRNAIEAMAFPTVMLRRLRLRTFQCDATTIEITVSDTGIGIGAGQAERLFEPFTSTKPGGLGMGLAISRRIVNAHGGRLWATCNPEGGMIFHCTLPASQEANS